MSLNEVLLVLLLQALLKGVQVNSQCSLPQSVTFNKWVGVRPVRPQPAFLYVARGDEKSLAEVCLSRCRELALCAGVSVAYSRGECTGVTAADTRSMQVDNDVNYFEKFCVEIPEKCSSNWWTVESTPGYHLHAEGRNVKLILNITHQECADAVLSDEKLGYRSAQWIANGDDNSIVDGESVTLEEASTGSCVLHVEDKYTEPESYRVANYQTIYLENQCRHDFPAKIDRCSYEEYYNQSLKHAELTSQALSKDECKSSCENETRFVCRGFSWTLTNKERDIGNCSLHSEDLLTLGSWLLKRTTGTSYYRRVLCLNISVECTVEDMLVTYRARGQFRGRVLVPGRAERCGAGPGPGGSTVKLVLPLHGECDVNFAHAVSNTPDGFVNRTMAYAMVLIQNNPIIQTAGDRWVRVGCSPTGSPRSARVHAALAVNSEQSGGAIVSDSVVAGSVAPASAVFNSSLGPPPLTMYVVRAGAEDDRDTPSGSAVSLGEILELRVESTEDREMEAFHLVASSRLGDSSVLLLDSRGCPTGQVDFPGFSRSRAGGIQRLSARFKAFRFPNSHVVRFALMVRFCDKRCSPVSCNLSRPSRDTIDGHSSDQEEGVPAAIREESAWGPTGGVVAQSGSGPLTLCGTRGDRVPLELELLVGSKDMLSADTLVRADHTREELVSAGVPSSAGALVCMHELLVVAAVLAWLAIQVLLLVGCCVVLKRYQRFADMASQKDYQSFDNVGFDTLSTHRRVHWPDQNVDILHAS